MKPIFKSYFTEINLGATLPGNGQPINFQDYPVLREVYLFGIQAVDQSVLAISPQNLIVVPLTTGITLTIQDKYQAEVIKDYPMFDLVPANQGGLYREFNPFPLNLVKSYITIRSNFGLAANQTAGFNLLYMSKKDFLSYAKQNGQPARKQPVRTRPR